MPEQVSLRYLRALRMLVGFDKARNSFDVHTGRWWRHCSMVALNAEGDPLSVCAFISWCKDTGIHTSCKPFSDSTGESGCLRRDVAEALLKRYAEAMAIADKLPVEPMVDADFFKRGVLYPSEYRVLQWLLAHRDRTWKDDSDLIRSIRDNLGLVLGSSIRSIVLATAITMRGEHLIANRPTVLERLADISRIEAGPEEEPVMKNENTNTDQSELVLQAEKAFLEQVLSMCCGVILKWYPWKNRTARENAVYNIALRTNVPISVIDEWERKGDYLVTTEDCKDEYWKSFVSVNRTDVERRLKELEMVKVNEPVSVIRNFINDSEGESQETPDRVWAKRSDFPMKAILQYLDNWRVSSMRSKKDFLEKIAARFNVSVQDVREWDDFLGITDSYGRIDFVKLEKYRKEQDLVPYYIPARSVVLIMSSDKSISPDADRFRNCMAIATTDLRVIHREDGIRYFKGTVDVAFEDGTVRTQVPLSQANLRYRARAKSDIDAGKYIRITEVYKAEEKRSLKGVTGYVIGDKLIERPVWDSDDRCERDWYRGLIKTLTGETVSLRSGCRVEVTEPLVEDLPPEKQLAGLLAIQKVEKDLGNPSRDATWEDIVNAPVAEHVAAIGHKFGWKVLATHLIRTNVINPISREKGVRFKVWLDAVESRIENIKRSNPRLTGMFEEPTPWKITDPIALARYKSAFSESRHEEIGKPVYGKIIGALAQLAEAEDIINETGTGGMAGVQLLMAYCYLQKHQLTSDTEYAELAKKHAELMAIASDGKLPPEDDEQFQESAWMLLKVEKFVKELMESYNSDNGSESTEEDEVATELTYTGMGEYIGENQLNKYMDVGPEGGSLGDYIAVSDTCGNWETESEQPSDSDCTECVAKKVREKIEAARAWFEKVFKKSMSRGPEPADVAAAIVYYYVHVGVFDNTEEGAWMQDQVGVAKKLTKEPTRYMQWMKASELLDKVRARAPKTLKFDESTLLFIEESMKQIEQGMEQDR